MGFSSSSFFVFIQQAPPSTTAVTTPFLHAVKHKLIYVCARNFCVLSIVFAFFLPFYFLLFFTSDLQFHCHFIFICWYIFIYKKHVYTFIFFCSIANWERIIIENDGKVRLVEKKWYNFALVNYGKVLSMFTHMQSSLNSEHASK